MLSCLDPDQQVLEVTSVSDLRSLITVCAHQRNSKLAMIVLNEMKRRGKERNVRLPLLCVMSSYARDGDVHGAKKLFNEISNLINEKDPRFWSLLAEAYATSNDLESSFLTLEELQKRGIIPTCDIYDVLLEACVRFNDLERTWHLFEFMRVRLYEPNLCTYKTMIDACSKTGSTEKAINLFEEVTSKNLQKNTEIYNALISSHIPRADYRAKSFDVFNSMVAANVIPNNRTYELLISASSKMGSIDCLKILLEDFYTKMRSDVYRERFFETPDILNSIVNANINLLKSLSSKTDSINVDNTQPNEAPFLKIGNTESRRIDVNYGIKELCVTDKATVSENSVVNSCGIFHVDSTWFSRSREMTNLLSLMRDTTPIEKLRGIRGSLRKELYSIDKKMMESESSVLSSITRIWEYLTLKPELITSQILDSYLELFASRACSPEDSKSVMLIFDELYREFGLAHSLDTFQLMLRWAGENSERSEKYAQHIFNTYLKYDEEMELSSFGSSSSTLSPLDNALRELERRRHGRSKNYTKSNFVLMANALSASENIDSSLAVLEMAKNFRYVDYLPKIHQSEVMGVFWMCYKLAYSDEFKPLAKFYTLVVPSKVKSFSLPLIDNDKLFKRTPETPFIEPPVPNPEFISAALEKIPEVHMYKFYPSIPKAQKNKSYY